MASDLSAVPHALPQDAESNVLVLYTGGTIGMLNTRNGFAPAPGFLYDHLRTQTRFHDPEGSGIANNAYSQDAYRAWASASNSPRPATHDSHTDIVAAAADAVRTSSSEVDMAQVTKLLSASSVSARPSASTTLEVATDTGPRNLPSLISPRNRTGKRIRYVILEYDPLIDSSDVGLHSWKTIALDIERNYAKFDAFLVLHGTDTMAYTASALSFMLEDLGKSVIITGAQIPLSELRNDAVDNLLGAMTIARDYLIPEVTLYFNHKLYRGARTTKSSAFDFEAFTSPNLPPLASTGTEVRVSWDLIQRPTAMMPFRVHLALESNVIVMSLFPGISGSIISAALQAPVRGLVLRTYGAGNAPQREDLITALAEATARGVVIVNITQCSKGSVSADYAAGQALAVRAGVISGLDMTVEAAYAKLCYLLGRQDLTSADVRQLLVRPVRGELTPPIVAQYKHSDSENRLHQLLLQTVNLNRSSDHAKKVPSEVAAGQRMTEQEVHVIHDTLLPILIAQAAGRDDGSLDKLIQQNHPLPLEVLNASSEVTRSPLHVAVQSGLLANVLSLLAAGASVHLRDTMSNTSPLRQAAQQGWCDIVQALVQAGAHLSETEAAAAQVDLQLAASSGNERAVEAWSLAGITAP